MCHEGGETVGTGFHVCWISLLYVKLDRKNFFLSTEIRYFQLFKVCPIRYFLQRIFSIFHKFANFSYTRIAYGPTLQKVHVAKISCSTLAFDSIPMPIPPLLGIAKLLQSLTFFMKHDLDQLEMLWMHVWLKYWRYNYSGTDMCYTCFMCMLASSTQILPPVMHNWCYS